MKDYECLLRGIRLGKAEVVRGCILADPSVVHAVDERLGLSAVFHAVLVQNFGALTVLLSHGGSPNTPNTLGDTPLHQAADDSAFAVAAELVRFGANVNARNWSGETPLHNAVYRNDLQLTELLLLNGADPNVQSSSSRQTPLHLAMAGQSNEIIAALLSSHASLDLADSTGQTPRSVAKATHREDLLDKIAKTLESKQTEVTHNSFIVRSFVSDPQSYLQTFNDDVRERMETLSSEEVRLLEVLQDIGLDYYFENFARLGYSSLSLLLELVQSDKSVTLDLLGACGVEELGARFAILVKLEQVTGAIPPIIIKHEPRTQQGVTLNLCGYRLVPPSYVLTIPQWLQELGLGRYIPCFEQAGFNSLELLYLQMYSSYPVTKQLLSLIGVQEGHQEVLLNKLTAHTELFSLADDFATCTCLLF